VGRLGFVLADALRHAGVEVLERPPAVIRRGLADPRGVAPHRRVLLLDDPLARGRLGAAAAGDVRTVRAGAPDRTR
jgi:hypothetical protein